MWLKQDQPEILNRKEGVAQAKQSSTERRKARHEGVQVVSEVCLIGGGCLSADLLPRLHRLPSSWALKGNNPELKLPYLDS